MSSPVTLIAAILLSCLALDVSGQAIAPSGVCAGVPEGYFVKDNENCKGYYYCRNGAGTYNVCPGDFYYNELEQICDYPDKVLCHVCQQKTGVQILPHPNSCEQFITCSEGVSYVGQCTEGYAFDQQKKVCNPTARVECKAQQSRCPAEENVDEVVFLQSHDRCDEYFICRSGTPIQMLCAPGLYWDAVHNRCDLKELVLCALP